MAPRLLIVDDNPEFLRRARLLLEAEGYEVVGAAEDGRRALAAAAELEPEIVLLDVNLPDGSGFDVAARLARESPDAAILMTSARYGDDYEPVAKRSGARGFVSKAELSGAAIERLLG